MTSVLGYAIMNMRERCASRRKEFAKAIMKNLGYYNGTYDLIERMTVPMNDRACYFGDGIFEVTYTRNHIPYSLEEHMDRLYASADELGIRIGVSKEQFSALLRDLIRKVDSDEQLVYWQVSRGVVAIKTSAFSTNAFFCVS